MEHIREHRSLLADAERRLLIAIARRLPPWINSDHLTLVGLLSMPLAAVAFANIPAAPWSAAAFVLALAANWLGDSLDGTLARVRNHLRPRYGFYVDHIFDSFGALFVLGGLALSGRMTPLVAAAVLIAYFLLSIEIYLATYCVGRFEMSHFGLGPTELRIVLAIGTLTLLVKPAITIAGQHFPLFDVGGIVAAIGLTITTVAAMVRHVRTLYAAEPLMSRLPVEVLHHLPDHGLGVAKEH